MLCLIIWLIGNKLIEDLGPNKTPLRINKVKAQTRALANTTEKQPSVIWTIEYLLEKNSDKNLSLIPVV